MLRTSLCYRSCHFRGCSHAPVKWPITGPNDGRWPNIMGKWHCDHRALQRQEQLTEDDFPPIQLVRVLTRWGLSLLHVYNHFKQTPSSPALNSFFLTPGIYNTLYLHIYQSLKFQVHKSKLFHCFRNSLLMITICHKILTQFHYNVYTVFISFFFSFFSMQVQNQILQILLTSFLRGDERTSSFDFFRCNGEKKSWFMKAQFHTA